MEKNNSPQTNVFGLESPESYKCKLIKLTDSHPTLTVKLVPLIANLPILEVGFSGIYYFDGPIFWTGANFEKATVEESIEIWGKAHPEESEKRIKQMATIFDSYVVRLPKTTIRIAAMGKSGPHLWIPKHQNDLL